MFLSLNKLPPKREEHEMDARHCFCSFFVFFPHSTMPPVSSSQHLHNCSVSHFHVLFVFVVLSRALMCREKESRSHDGEEIKQTNEEEEEEADRREVKGKLEDG